MNFPIIALLGLFLVPGQAFACFDKHEVPEDLTRCAVVLSDGLEVEGLDGQVETLAFLEPLILDDLLDDERAIIRRESGFQGTTDATVLRIYERIGKDLLASRVSVGDVLDPADDLCQAPSKAHVVAHKPNEPGEKTCANPLEAKVVVANTVERLDRLQDTSETPNVISMRDQPSQKGRLLGKLDIFNVLTVHGEDVTDGEQWFFLGRRGLDYRDYDDVLLGWVRQSDAYLWPQRQAVYPRSPAGRAIFENPGLTEVGYEVDFQDDAADDRNFAIGKMPLVNSFSDSRALEVIVAVSRTGSYTKSGQPLVSTDDTRQRFWQLLGSIGQREVLFVIDNTESMAPYRQAVIDGILQFVAKSEDAGDTRYAFALFGDRFNIPEDGRKWADERGRWTPRVRGEMKKRGEPFQFALKNFRPFGEAQPSAADLSEFFGGAYRDRIGDKPEMGLSALELAIKMANWQQLGTVRVVVYVGDDKDRDGAVARAAEALADHDVTLLSLNVAAGDIDAHNELWLEDIRRLRAEIETIREVKPNNALVVSPAVAYARGGNDDTLPTRDFVTNHLEGFLVIDSEFAGLAKTDLLGSGDSVEQAVKRINSRLAELNVASATFLDDFLAARGLDSSEALAQFFAENDTVSTGYMPDDQEKLELYVAMTRRELGSIFRAMDAVCTDMTDSAALERTFGDIAVKLAETFLGEDRRGEGDRFFRGESGESISEFFARLLSLPVEYFSIFDDQSVEQFVDYVEKKTKKDEYNAIHQEVCLSTKLLQTVYDGEYSRREYFEFFENDKRFNQPIFRLNEGIGSLKKFDWAWGPRGREGEDRVVEANSFYFVPQDFFPQKNP